MMIGEENLKKKKKVQRKKQKKRKKKKRQTGRDPDLLVTTVNRSAACLWERS